VGTPSERIPEPGPPPSEPAPPRTPRERLVAIVQRRRRLLIVLASLLVLYTIFGFLILPLIVRRQLEKRLTAALHRETTVARVRTNPYAFSVTIDGFLVKDPDGTPFISWDRFYVKHTLWRIILRELTLEKVALVRFHSRVAMDKNGRLNFQDLVDESSSSPEPPPAPEKKRPLVFAVQELDVQQAQIDFSDRTHREAFGTTIGPFDVRVQGFRTLPDSTSPYSFAGKTESGETFSWAGNLLTEPLRSSGTISFDGLRLQKYSPYYEEAVGFEIRDGRLGLKTGYTFEWGPDRHVLQVSDGAIAVRTLVLGVRGIQQNKVELPAADVNGIAIDVMGRTARVNAAVLKDGVVRARRNANGQTDLEMMGPPKKAGPPPKESSQSKEKSKPFHWALGAFELSGWRVEFQDDLPHRPASLTLAPIDIRLENMADSPQQSSKLTASIGFSGKGKVDLAGAVRLLRPAADLAIDIDALDLGQFDSYLDLYGNLAARLGSGKLGLKGHARFDGGADPVTWSFEGDTHVDDLNLLESERSQEVARWKTLNISEIKTASTPIGPSLSVRSVRWIQPRFVVARAEDGSSNVSRLVKAPPPKPEKTEAKPETAEAKSESEASQAKPATPAKQAPNRPQPPMSIASFQIIRGTATFVDRSVKPPVTLAMTDLDVRLRGLSNALNARSQVSIKALASGGPLEVTGIVSPRLVNDATDVKVTSKGIDLTPLSPYCGKYAGFVLDKGKMDLDLDYKIARRKVQGTNQVKVDQFTFGEATNSKDATKLPVKLGVAVLQDANGVIDLNVPVTGNVDDPNFRLYKLVWKAFGDVVVKAVTSPFTLLGKLFGGGGSDKLDVIDFQAGAPELTTSADKTLQNLSKALASRPALKVDLESTTDPAADLKALKLRELRRQAQVAKGGKAELTDEEYVRFVEKKYKALAPPATGGGPPDPAAMEDGVVATVQLPPEAIGALRQQRAEAARARLVSLGVDPNRLSPTQGGERAKKEAGARVYFTLK
jgi:hypothetical protein